MRLEYFRRAGHVIAIYENTAASTMNAHNIGFLAYGPE